MNLNPEQTAFLFPGQGSQTVGMGAGLSAAYNIAQDTFNDADQVLGFPLKEIAWQGPSEKLNDTQYLLQNSWLDIQWANSLH